MRHESDGTKPSDAIDMRTALARKIVAEGLDPATTAVSAAMTRKLVTVVGIVSLTDLAKVLGEMAEDEKYLQSFADGERSKVSEQS